MPEICCLQIHVHKGKGVSRRGVEEEGKVQNGQNGRRKVRELLYLSVAYAANTGGVSNSDTYTNSIKCKRVVLNTSNGQD